MAQIVQATLISESRDGRRAQVVVYIGIGRNRRSVTRHVRRQGQVWIGDNPDNQVPGLHATADAAMESAEKNLGKAISHLAKLGTISYTEQAKVVEALEAALPAAQAEKERVEREFPLRLEFKF